MALSDVVHRYAAHVDDREFGAVAELFTTEAELVVPSPPADLLPTHAHRGRAAIARAVGAVAAVARTEHAIVGEVYEAAGRRGPRAGASRASLTTGTRGATRWWMWCGTCATTTHTS